MLPDINAFKPMKSDIWLVRTLNLLLRSDGLFDATDAWMLEPRGTFLRQKKSIKGICCQRPIPENRFLSRSSH